MYSDGSPSTSSSSATESSDPCQVCGIVAHGKHFGALVCRACAAFFRRAVIGKYSELKCKSKSDNCEFVKSAKLQCKKCRLKRCFDVGMNPNRFQFDHDLISTTNQFVKKSKLRDNIPNSMESFLGRPHCIITFEPELASPIKTMIDLGFLIDRALDVLNKGIFYMNNVAGMNNLEKMAFGLNTVRQPKTSKIVNLKKIGQSETFALWEDDILRVATWLTYCEEFQKLDNSVKIKILKCIWQVWIRLETIARTAEMRIKKECEEGLVMLTNEVSFDFDKIEVDVSWFSNYREDQLREFLDPMETVFLEDVIGEFVKLRPTDKEQAFMLSQICFQLAGKLYQGTILETSEKMHDLLSNEIHNYYVNEMNLPNYGMRLTQMMKINNTIKNDMLQKVEKKDVGRIFDTFTIDFTHPEVFFTK